jgi:lysosomal Pro-X carboxypeptidase
MFGHRLGPLLHPAAAETDMFWPDRWDADEAAAGCKQQWGVETGRIWATVEWGGRRISAASNIVFSNGLYDPWHGGGVLQNISDSVRSVIIPEVSTVLLVGREAPHT